MKQFGFIAAIAVFLASAAFAQTLPKPTGVGLIDFSRAVSRNDEGVQAANSFTEEGKKLEAALLKSQVKVTDLQDKLSKSGATMSESEKSTLVKDIEKAKKDYEREQEDAQTALNDKQEALIRPIADRVKKVIEAYAKELNLAVVLNFSQDMVYSNDVLDITTEIIRRTNADIVKNPAKR